MQPGRTPSVAIIGAGLGGIATLVKLTRAGFEDVVVFEKSGGPGGTWWDNRYPGCAVDVPSHAYSFSFMSRYDWSGTHAHRDELQQYCEDVIDAFALRPKFRFGAEVSDVRWDEEEDCYEVALATGARRAFTAVVSCVGMLSQPRYPDWPGLDDFAGPKFHTARWEPEHDLRGKRVACVGTGSTAAQLVPALAPTVAELKVFQREPGWVIPKDERDFTAAERRRYAQQPWRVTAARARFFAHDWRFANTAFRVGSRQNTLIRDVSLGLIDEQIGDPALRAAVTPAYPWGCKRAVVTSTFYGALDRPNVVLVPHAVTRVTPGGIVDSEGVEHTVDALVMSTGFRPYGTLLDLPITGPGGRALQDLWRGDPQAFLGITVPGMPNLFIVYGPNTNGASSIVTQLEMQADVIVGALKRLRRSGATRIETRPALHRAFVRWVDRRNLRMQSAGFTQCRNYYFAPSGRNVTQWPSSHLQYLAMSRLLPPVALAAR